MTCATSFTSTCRRSSFTFHDDAETGQLMSRLTADIEGIRNSLTLGFLRVGVVVITFGSVAIILGALDWQLAVVILLCVPVLAFLATHVARRLRPLWAGVQNETGELSTIMQESLNGHRVVLSFAREEFENEKFDAQNRQLRDLNLAALRTSAWNQPLMLLALNIVTGAHHLGRRRRGDRRQHQARHARGRRPSTPCCWARPSARSASWSPG